MTRAPLDTFDLAPAGSPPTVAWGRRRAQLVGHRQYRITIPCVLTASIDQGVHAALTGELRRRWIDAPKHRPGRISSVVAAFGGLSGAGAHLTLAITTATPHALDDSSLGHDLSEALACALPTAALSVHLRRP